MTSNTLEQRFISLKIPQDGIMRGAQSPIWRSQCNSQNLHSHLLVILLAKIVDRYSKTHENMPTVSTKEKINGQTSATTSPTKSGTTECQDPCRPLWTNVGCWSPTQIHFVHNGCFYQIRVDNSSGKQGSVDGGQGHLQ